MECLFCKIIAGKIPAAFQYQDETIIAFKDINPQAPIHTLIIPRLHISTLNDLLPDNASLISQMAQTAKTLAAEFNIHESGYRLVMNCNEGAGQSVFHIHMHLLGGRAMTWPPG